jgi:hypothetical protein
MTRNRVVLALVGASLLLLILVGRHEQSVWQVRENRGIASVRRAVGTDLPKPTAYQSGASFACLLYPNGKDLYGLELCFAPTGAIVEAIQRAAGVRTKIWTLRSDPGRATVHQNPALIARLLDRLGAQTGSTIQVGGLDVGARVPTYGPPP